MLTNTCQFDMSNQVVANNRLYVSLMFLPQRGNEHASKQEASMELRIEFPNRIYAEAYLKLIPEEKDAVGSGHSGTAVFLRLPSSLRKLEASRTQGGFIFTFQSRAAAKEWSDPICKPLSGQPNDILVKQYWELEELDRALQLGDDPPKGGMRPPPPGPAKGSSAAAERRRFH